MTLLARAAGIPARYCEGYLMQNEWEGSSGYDKNRVWTGYSISPRDGHAFPELYIRGCGWVAFEPTRTDSIAAANSEKKETTTHLLSKAGMVLLVAALIMLLLIIVMPSAVHRLFMLVNSRRRPDKAVAAVIHRLCRLYGIANVNTADEAAALIRSASGADISAAAELFNRMAYGGAQMSESDRAKAMEDYLNAYDALRESRKIKRKTAK